MEVTKEYAACPTCNQYSHSIAGGFVEEASLHFEAMYSHRGDGFPTQHCFDERTRDMAQRLLAELTTAHAETAALRAEVERLREVLRDIAGNGDPDFLSYSQTVALSALKVQP